MEGREQEASQLAEKIEEREELQRQRDKKKEMGEGKYGFQKSW